MGTALLTPLTHRQRIWSIFAVLFSHYCPSRLHRENIMAVKLATLECYVWGPDLLPGSAAAIQERKHCASMKIWIYIHPCVSVMSALLWALTYSWWVHLTLPHNLEDVCFLFFTIREEKRTEQKHLELGIKLPAFFGTFLNDSYVNLLAKCQNCLKSESVYIIINHHVNWKPEVFWLRDLCSVK